MKPQTTHPPRRSEVPESPAALRAGSPRRLAATVVAFGIVLLVPTGCGKPDGEPSAAAPETRPAPAPNAVKAVVTSSGVEMVHVPTGEFTMGTSQGNADEAPPHRVKITAFLIDRYEVSHARYAAVQLPDPSRWQGNPRGPVERVRWRDAKQYCNERSLAEGLRPCYNEKTPDWDCDFTADGYRLPTEAEWEYAARAGTTGPYDFGAADRLRNYAWFGGNAEGQTHPGGQKKPNAWGIHDLYGNVSEWCEDVYQADFYAVSPATDPAGPPNPGKDVKRVIRGGSWKSSAEACRVTFRQGEKTGDSDACFSTDYCGFRCVRRITPEALAKLAPASE